MDNQRGCVSSGVDAADAWTRMPCKTKHCWAAPKAKRWLRDTEAASMQRAPSRMQAVVGFAGRPLSDGYTFQGNQLGDVAVVRRDGH